MLKTRQMCKAPVKCEPPVAHRKQWELGIKSKIASSTPLPLSCPSPMSGLLCGLTNWEDS